MCFVNIIDFRNNVDDRILFSINRVCRKVLQVLAEEELKHGLHSSSCACCSTTFQLTIDAKLTWSSKVSSFNCRYNGPYINLNYWVIKTIYASPTTLEKKSHSKNNSSQIAIGILYLIDIFWRLFWRGCQAMYFKNTWDNVSIYYKIAIYTI